MFCFNFYKSICIEEFVGLQNDPGCNGVPDDHFLDQLVRCQGSRLEDQRSPLPTPAVDSESDPPIANPRKSGATVPDEDFFSLIMRFQSGRMDDQRAAVPRIEARFVFWYLIIIISIFLTCTYGLSPHQLTVGF